MKQLGVPVPSHSRDTTDRLVCELAKCGGREVEVSDLAPDTTVRYDDIYALALVFESVHEDRGKTNHIILRQLTRSGHLLATYWVLIRIGTVVSSVT